MNGSGVISSVSMKTKAERTRWCEWEFESPTPLWFMMNSYNALRFYAGAFMAGWRNRADAANRWRIDTFGRR